MFFIKNRLFYHLVFLKLSIFAQIVIYESCNH